jgi:hypothetical protein
MVVAVTTSGFAAIVTRAVRFLVGAPVEHVFYKQISCMSCAVKMYTSQMQIMRLHPAS